MSERGCERFHDQDVNVGALLQADSVAVYGCKAGTELKNIQSC